MLLLVANTIVFLPFALLRRLPPVALRSFFYKMYTRALGITLRRHGAALDASHVLYVSNHISYIDIAALMSLTGARFVSRGDIAKLPFFGWLMKRYGTVFIHRVRSDVRGQITLLQRLLDEGSPLLLFAEGTTGDGRSVLPVKSSLFAALESFDARNLALQPISLRYSLLDGVPMSTYWEPMCAWYGEMSFLPHLWEVLSLHRITIDVYVHPSTPLVHIEERKVWDEKVWRVSAGRAPKRLHPIALPRTGGHLPLPSQKVTRVVKIELLDRFARHPSLHFLRQDDAAKERPDRSFVYVGGRQQEEIFSFHFSSEG